MCICRCVPGGSTLYVETSLTEAIDRESNEKNSPSLDMTGQLGDVMKESANISYTFSKVKKKSIVIAKFIIILINLVDHRLSHYCRYTYRFSLFLKSL